MSNIPPQTDVEHGSQFTLRQLFVVTTAIACVLALTLWFGEFGFLGGCILATAVAAYSRGLKALEIAVVVGILAVLVLLVMPAIQFSRKPYNQTACSHRLKWIGLALANYAADNKAQYPPLVTHNDAGRPLHSWRVHMLIGMERSDLFQRYDLTEPWDGPLNSQLHGENIPFLCPSSQIKTPGVTSYLAIELPDYRPGDWFAVIEVPNPSVGFFEPKDITLEELLSPKTQLGSHANGQALHILWPDGEVELVRRDQLAKRLTEYGRERLLPNRNGE